MSHRVLAPGDFPALNLYSESGKGAAKELSWFWEENEIQNKKLMAYLFKFLCQNQQQPNISSDITILQTIHVVKNVIELQVIKSKIFQNSN